MEVPLQLRFQENKLLEKRAGAKIIKNPQGIMRQRNCLELPELLYTHMLVLELNLTMDFRIGRKAIEYGISVILSHPQKSTVQKHETGIKEMRCVVLAKKKKFWKITF